MTKPNDGDLGKTVAAVVRYHTHVDTDILTAEQWLSCDRTRYTVLDERTHLSGGSHTKHRHFREAIAVKIRHHVHVNRRIIAVVNITDQYTRFSVTDVYPNTALNDNTNLRHAVATDVG